MKASRLALAPSSILLLALSLASASPRPDPHHRPLSSHPRRLSKSPPDLALARRNATVGTEHMLEKRGSFNGRATFYEAGLGACGATNSDSDYIVALNYDQYGDPSAVSSYCFETITITYGDKSEQATILDACESCPYGGIDMSPGLFDAFASASVGVIYVSWSVGSAAASTTSTSSTWSSTSTYSAPSSTSTWSAPSSSSSVWSSSSSSASGSSSASSSSSAISSSDNSTLLSSNLSSTVASNSSFGSSTATSAGSASSASTVVSTSLSGGNLDSLNQLVIALGGLVLGAAENASQ